MISGMDLYPVVLLLSVVMLACTCRLVSLMSGL